MNQTCAHCGTSGAKDYIYLACNSLNPGPIEHRLWFHTEGNCKKHILNFVNYDLWWRWSDGERIKGFMGYQDGLVSGNPICYDEKV